MNAPSAGRQTPTVRELLEGGAARLESGDLAGALEVFEEGAHRFPDEWRFAANAGTVLHRLGSVGAALRRLNQALVRWPSVPLLHHKLAAWLLELGQEEAAVRLLERAAALDGAGVESLMQLGVACLETQRVERALAVATRSIERAPENAEAHALHGIVLAALGERAASDAALRRALALDPGCAQAAHHLARRGEPLDPAPLRARIEDHRLPPSTRSKLAFALGCLHERRGEHAEAFASFARGNALARRPWDPARHSALVDALIEVSRDDSFARVDPARAGSAPIFVVGLPRTGSTLVEQILAAHPEVHAVGEHARGLPRLARELPALRPGVRAFPTRRPAPRDPAVLAECYRASPRRPGARACAPSTSCSRISDAGLIALLFPDAHPECRRDPRQRVSTFFLEFSATNPWSYDLEHIALYYRDYERLMRHWTAHLPLPVLDVPYEELVAEPEAWTRRVLEFVGLAFDPRCLRHEEAQRPVFTASALQVREKLHGRAVGRWKAYASFLGPLAELAAGGRAGAISP
jgi:Flp pilus assembly protein TadD